MNANAAVLGSRISLYHNQYQYGEYSLSIVAGDGFNSQSYYHHHNPTTLLSIPAFTFSTGKAEQHNDNNVGLGNPNKNERCVWVAATEKIIECGRDDACKPHCPRYTILLSSELYFHINKRRMKTDQSFSRFSDDFYSYLTCTNNQIAERDFEELNGNAKVTRSDNDKSARLPSSSTEYIAELPAGATCPNCKVKTKLSTLDICKSSSTEQERWLEPKGKQNSYAFSGEATPDTEKLGTYDTVPVDQLEDHHACNVKALGSNPSGYTFKSSELVTQFRDRQDFFHDPIPPNQYVPGVYSYKLQFVTAHANIFTTHPRFILHGRYLLYSRLPTQELASLLYFSSENPKVKMQAHAFHRPIPRCTKEKNGLGGACSHSAAQHLLFSVR